MTGIWKFEVSSAPSGRKIGGFRGGKKKETFLRGRKKENITGKVTRQGPEVT